MYEKAAIQAFEMMDPRQVLMTTSRAWECHPHNSTSVKKMAVMKKTAVKPLVLVMAGSLYKGEIIC